MRPEATRAGPLTLTLKMLEWLARNGWWERPPLLVRDVGDAELQKGTLFREMRDGHPKWAHFSCPRCCQ